MTNILLTELPSVILSHILECLDPLSLVELAGWSSATDQILEGHELWDKLESKIPTDCASMASTCFRRVLRHAVARKFAAEMQTQVLQHFMFHESYWIESEEQGEREHIKGSLEWKGCRGCDTFPDMNLLAFYGPIEFSQFEFFLRLARRDNCDTLFEGFVQGSYEYGEDRRGASVTQIHLNLQTASDTILSNWPELKDFVDQSVPEVYQVDEVLVTVIALNRDDDYDASFVVSSCFLQQTRQLRDGRVELEFAQQTHQFGRLHEREVDEAPSTRYSLLSLFHGRVLMEGEELDEEVETGRLGTLTISDTAA